MKTLGLVLVLMILCMGAAQAQQATPTRMAFAPGELNAVSLYGRAQAFHDIVQVQHCEQINAQAVTAINQRFEYVRAQLADRFGEKAVPVDHPLPPQIAGQSCDSLTIDSYSRHVKELEQYLSNLGASGQATPSTPLPEASSRAPVDDSALDQLLQQAEAQIKAGRNTDAINGPLAQVIHAYEAAYAHSQKRLYCAESLTESLLYLATAANHHQEAQVLSKPAWALAYYLRGYAYGALSDTTNAEASLKQALELSPSNAQFLSELGNVYENQKNWSAALKTFQSADEAADVARPEQKISLRCRALRGQGYVLVELHQLEDAAQKYQNCLTIHPGDQSSINELNYVRGLQSKAAQ
jgi:tetratricopeptide (TPR) repeat protein